MTTSEQLSQSIDKFGATALKMKAQRDAAVEALYEVRELIEGYVDVEDGDYGVPAANKAMRAVQRIDEAIKEAERK